MSDVDVTPTEDLLMGVLASRVRGGEGCWTFENTHLRTLRTLRAKGLLDFDSAPTPKAQRAYLTDLGRATYLSAGYAEPATHLRNQLAEMHARELAANETVSTVVARARGLKARAETAEAEIRRLTGATGPFLTEEELRDLDGKEVTVTRVAHQTIRGVLQVGRNGRGQLTADGHRGSVPFAIIDRANDAWYRLHLTDDGLGDVDLVQAGHR